MVGRVAFMALRADRLGGLGRAGFSIAREKAIERQIQLTVLALALDLAQGFQALQDHQRQRGEDQHRDGNDAHKGRDFVVHTTNFILNRMTRLADIIGHAFYYDVSVES